MVLLQLTLGGAMKLHVLGSAGYHGNGFRETTCLAIPELSVVLDAGTSFFRLRKLMGAFPSNQPIDVFLSHGHLDHIIGLSYIMTTMRALPQRKFLVHAAPLHLDAVNAMLGSPLFPLSMEFMGLVPSALQKLDTSHRESVTTLGTRVTSCTVPHPGMSVAYRFESDTGHSFAYVTDTQAQYVRKSFVEDVDTLIHECNFPDSLRDIAEASGHSCLSDVLRLAERARAKKLVLMHFNNFPEMEAGEPISNLVGELPASLPCEVVLTNDNMVVEI